MMKYHPHVNTDIGPGRLFRIEGAMAHVEFDYMYLVEIPLNRVCLDDVDLARMESGGDRIETMERGTGDRKSG